jgi:hypothetical protein
MKKNQKLGVPNFWVVEMAREDGFQFLRLGVERYTESTGSAMVIGSIQAKYKIQSRFAGLPYSMIDGQIAQHE